MLDFFLEFCGNLVILYDVLGSDGEEHLQMILFDLFFQISKIETRSQQKIQIIDVFHENIFVFEQMAQGNDECIFA